MPNISEAYERIAQKTINNNSAKWQKGKNMAYTTKELQKAMDVLNKSSNNDYCLECQSCINNGNFVSAEESKCADRKESNI